MKHAIISDIHGNYHAFTAVLADAKAQGADMFLLLGDYTSNYPFGNDVVSAMRKLEPITAIRGNGEGYFTNLHGCDPSELSHEQFKPVYWGYRTLTPKNHEYLAGLPETTTISSGKFEIHLAHSLRLFFRNPKVKLFHSDHFRALMNAERFTRDEYLVRAKDALLSCPEAVAEMMQLPKGIYLFGHNHLQFHMEYEGRLFINPGSCGEPLDWDTRAPYTLLTVTESGWAVDERRVEYDLEAAADGLSASGFTEYAPVWSEILKLELFTGKDHFAPFVMHLAKTSQNMGSTEFPVNNDVWDAAVKTWDANMILV